MPIKTADAKGRIALGPEFANRTVIIEQIDETELRVIAAAVVPERELWLHRNQEAKSSVHRGLEQARGRQFSKRPPDLARDAKLVEQLDD